MGFLGARSMTISAFRVNGGPPRDHRVRFVMDVQRWAFEGRDDVGEGEQTCGWTRAGHPFEPPSEHELFVGTRLLLSFRLDRRTVPARLLKHRCAGEVARLAEERGVERLSRRDVREIRDRVRASLMKQMLPRIQVYDMVWQLDTGRVFFTGTGQTVCTLFTEHFERCFGLSLNRETLKSRAEMSAASIRNSKAARKAG